MSFKHERSRIPPKCIVMTSRLGWPRSGSSSLLAALADAGRSAEVFEPSPTASKSLGRALRATSALRAAAARGQTRAMDAWRASGPGSTSEGCVTPRACRSLSRSTAEATSAACPRSQTATPGSGRVGGRTPELDVGIPAEEPGGWISTAFGSGSSNCRRNGRPASPTAGSMDAGSVSARSWP